MHRCCLRLSKPSNNASTRKCVAALCEALLGLQAVEGGGAYQVGKTKVFLTSTAIEQLDHVRRVQRKTAATAMQATVRMLKASRWVRAKRLAILSLQCGARVQIARRAVATLAAERLAAALAEAAECQRLLAEAAEREEEQRRIAEAEEAEAAAAKAAKSRIEAAEAAARCAKALPSAFHLKSPNTIPTPSGGLLSPLRQRNGNLASPLSRLANAAKNAKTAFSNLMSPSPKTSPESDDGSKVADDGFAPVSLMVSPSRELLQEASVICKQIEGLNQLGFGMPSLSRGASSSSASAASPQMQALLDRLHSLKTAASIPSPLPAPAPATTPAAHLAPKAPMPTPLRPR